MMVPNQIIVRCENASFEYARVIGLLDVIVIEYGAFESNTFIGQVSESLRKSEHPEMYEVFDGYGWNASELAALVNQCCMEREHRD